MLFVSAKIKYLCMLFSGEVLHHFDTFYAEVGSKTSEDLKYIISVLGTYYFPDNDPSKQKCVMRRRMKNPRGLNVR